MACVFLLAGIMTAGMDAQPRRGWGYGGWGYGGYGYGRTGDFYGYGPGTRAPWSQLDLTDEQEEALNTLRLEHYQLVKPLRSKMLDLQVEEQNILAQDQSDTKALNNLIDQQTDLANQIRKLRVEHQAQVRSVLTEEQRMILDQSRSYGYYGYGRGRGFANPRGFRHWGGAAGRWGDGYGRWGGRFGGRGLGPCGMGLGPGGW